MMILTTYQFDTEKNQRIQRRAESRHADLMREGERKTDARDRLNQAQRRVDEWNLKHHDEPPAQLTEPVEAYQGEFDRAVADYERAEERWQSLNAVASNLAEAVTDWQQKSQGKVLPASVVGSVDAEAASYANAAALRRG